MGISHEYHATRGHGRRGGAGGKLRLLGAIAAILILSFAITAILENGQKHQDEAEQTATAGTAQNILAPLPMQGAADSTTDSAVSGGENAAADGTPADPRAVRPGPSDGGSLQRQSLRQQRHPPACQRPGRFELLLRCRLPW